MPGILSILSRLREAAEAAKIKLSDAKQKSEIALPFLTPDFSFSHVNSRARNWNRWRAIIVLRTREHCLRSLADAKLEAKDSRSSDSRGRPDAHAAGARSLWRNFSVARSLRKRAAAFGSARIITRPPGRN